MMAGRYPGYDSVAKAAREHGVAFMSVYEETVSQLLNL